MMSVVNTRPTAEQKKLRSDGVCRADRLGIARSTCAEISRLAMNEFEIKAEGKGDISGMKEFIPTLRILCEALCRYGEATVKPYFSAGKLKTEIIPCGSMKILGRNGLGEITSAEFTSELKREDRIYRRYERHTLMPGGYRITGRATVTEARGREQACPLSSVPEWEDISPDVFIKNLDRPLFSVFELISCDGIAPIFRRGEELITEINRQFDRLTWEYEGGELAVDASEDAFRIGKDGRPELPMGKERLWRTNALDMCSSQNELLKIFAPALRDESYIRGLNRLMMQYEDAVGLSRGTFSDDPHDLPRTAAEVKSTEAKTLSLVSEVRDALIKGLNGLLGAYNVLGELYGVTDGKTKLKITAGDGITDGKTKETELDGQ